MRDQHRVSGLLKELVLSMCHKCHFRSYGLRILILVNGLSLCSRQQESPLLEMFSYLHEKHRDDCLHLLCLHLVMIHLDYLHSR